MKLKDYLSSKIIFICFFFIFFIVLTAFLAILEVSFLMIIMLDAFFLITLFLYYGVEYYIHNKRIKKIRNIVNGIDEKYLIGEVLPEPFGSVEKEYFEIMKIISRGSIEVAENAKREKDEYCEYVENWIHEIKTPLTACSLILKNGTDSAKLKRELKRAENQTENILYYARLKKVEKDLIINKFNVREIIDEAVKAQMEILIAAEISISVEGDFAVHSDSKSFKFIIQQLLINCAKYAAKKEVKIVAKDNCVSVNDNGVGIPGHEILRITERGFTGTNGRLFGESTGMGLYIVKGLCSALDVKLEIKSKVNEYTSVFLTFLNLTKM